MQAKVKNKSLNKTQEEIINLKKSLLNLNFQKSTGQLEKTSQIKKIRRNIASLKTKLNSQKGKENA